MSVGSLDPWVTSQQFFFIFFLDQKREGGGGVSVDGDSPGWKGLHYWPILHGWDWLTRNPKDPLSPDSPPSKEWLIISCALFYAVCQKYRWKQRKRTMK